MNKKRIEFIYKLKGTITHRTSAKASPQSKYAGQEYYVLGVALESPHQAIKSLQVFPDKLINPEIWTIIEKSQPTKKKHLFYCRNVRGYYYLVNWEEIKAEEKP